MAKFYGVSADYLLGMTENRLLDNISISELHLSDAALSLLKDRKLNTLLLSELITHEQFQKLMLDLEIYVDGLADMQVKSLNLAVEADRKILLKRHNPDEYNLLLNVLKASHLSVSLKFWSLTRRNGETVQGRNTIRTKLLQNKRTCMASAIFPFSKLWEITLLFLPVPLRPSVHSPVHHISV